MFEDLIAQKPDVEIEKLVGDDYYRVVYTELGGSTTVVSGIVKGVTFSFQIPGLTDRDSVRAMVHAVMKGVEENVFLDAHAIPGANKIDQSLRAHTA